MGQKRPPGPKGRPIVGSLFDLRRDPLAFLLAAHREFGDVIRFRMPLQQVTLVAHPDHAQHVLQERHRIYTKNNIDYRILKQIVGEGLLTSDGEFWLRQRRLIQPLFHRRAIADLADMMTRTTLDLLEAWKPRAERGDAIDLADEMSALTFRIVGKAVFDLDVSSDVDVVGRNTTIVNEHIGRHYLEAMVPFLPTPANLRFRRARRALDEVVRRLIAERRRENAERPDLLSMLVQARDEETGRGIDDRQIRDEAITLLLAGHETTANALNWTWRMLSEHADVERSLHAEVDEALGGRPPGADDLARLPYTRMVLEETMRLYPPAWMVTRTPSEDDVIGGYPIRKGSIVLVAAWVTHRHAEFWDDAERFDPERFSPERSEHRHRFAYFPFGGGPRLCIGAGFAMTEAVLVLATIAQRYRVRMVPGHPIALQPLVTLRPAHGLRVTLAPR